MKRYHLLKNDIDVSLLKNRDNTRVIYCWRWEFPSWAKVTAGAKRPYLQKSHGRFDLRLVIDLPDEYIVLLKLQGLYIEEITKEQLSAKLRKQFNK